MLVLTALKEHPKVHLPPKGHPQTQEL